MPGGTVRPDAMYRSSVHSEAHPIAPWRIYGGASLSISLRTAYTRNSTHQSYLPPLRGLIRGDLLEHSGNGTVLLERVWDGDLRRLDRRVRWSDRHYWTRLRPDVVAVERVETHVSCVRGRRTSDRLLTGRTY